MTDTNNMILANVIRSKARSNPDFEVAKFVNVDANGKFAETSRTYLELWENGLRVAQALEEEGISKGDRFALIMQNHPEFVDAMIGSGIAGSVFVPIDARSKGERLHYLVDFPECAGAIIADYSLGAFRDVLGKLPKIRWVWVLDTGLGIETPDLGDVRVKWLSDVLESAVPGPIEIKSLTLDEPMQLLFTSGTTGNPKAIVSPHSRYASIARSAQDIGLRSDDRLYTGLSLTHANAQCLTLGAALYTEVQAVISRQFTKSKLWEILRRYSCTVFNLLGGMATAVYSDTPRPDDADNPVRLVISAGMPASIWDDFADRFDVEILEFYGTAEGGMTINPPGIGPKGSVGKPVPNLLCAILDEVGTAVPPGERGEICFRPAQGSPSVAYFRNEKASEEKIRGGWFHSGDVGRMDEDGWLYFDYREGYSIRRNGEFIDTGYIEKTLADSQLLRDVFIYGIELESCAPGEKELVAAIVPLVDPLDSEALSRWCRQRLPRNVVPSYFQVLAEIPKTASEKPIERVMKERFLSGSDIAIEVGL